MTSPRRTVAALASALLAGLLLAPPAPSAAAGAPGTSPAGSFVGEVPTTTTPHVLDGRVLSIAEVGDTMLLGGSFTRTRDYSGATEIARRGLVAFDAASGRIDPSFPQTDGTVQVVLPAGDGSVYVGGSFTSIGGAARKNLARVRVSDGAVLPFDAGRISGQVRDLRLSGGRLWVAGQFTHVAGRAQTALATLDPATGSFDPYMGRTIAGVHNGGTTNVIKIDVDPAGSRLVAIGNFDTVDGVRRHQMLVLDLGESPTLGFGTAFYEAPCAVSFDTYMRDVSMAPDGTYFVVGTTGSYGGAQNACDTTARFETGSTGEGVEPSWVDKTGGDTTWAVEATGSAVYTGGHARWQNNPWAGNAPGRGAVARPGIAALDPTNGLPLSWNPGRTRGVGVFDFLLTDRGLYVGSDTDRIGADYYRARIALLPGPGTSYPAVVRPTLPDDVHLLGSTAGPATVTARRFEGAAVTAPDRQVATGGVDWNQVTGAFMVNGRLYAGWRDGSFDRRPFDGTSFGAPTAVDTADQLVRQDDWHGEVDDVTGMFLDHGRLYYTLAGSSSLYYRYFTPQSDVVGARRMVASAAVPGFDPRSVRSMFLAGGDLWWADATGTLRRTPWVDGAVAGAPAADRTTVVSGPAVDGRSWATRALVAYQDADGNGADGAPNQAPTAAFSAGCTELACRVDGTGSEDADGSVVSWQWDFGDGASATGATAEHTYDQPGTYEVRLTVTDEDGATASTTRTVEAALAQTDLAQVATVGRTASGTTHAVDVPATVRAGDTMLLFLTLNSTQGSLSAPPGWTPLEQGDSTNFRSRAWVRTATADDVGSTVRVTTSATLKADLTLGAYRAGDGAGDGAGASAVVTDSAVTALSAAGTEHTSPTVSVDDPGSWLVTYWGDKSAGATTWSPPAGQVERRQGTTSGGGSVSALAVDSGAPVPTGTAGGLVATTDVASARMSAYSVVLAPR